MMSEPAVYMNHSCDANTRPTLNALGAYDFIATRDIQAAEELTFDYRETETEISSGFDCRCGAATCIGSLGAS